ncbi:MAG TPA: cobyric acid synthase [Gemmatimonadaceae bacterium]|jgi:adenosylcobyric acid synthase
MSIATLPLGRVLMVQGTTSDAGKSTLVAALCRLLTNAGYRVAPFKAQNMSNNAAVTADGGEVGRAQAMQAAAARIAVTVEMNPVLLKPQADNSSQIVVLGKARRVANAREFYALKAELWPIVTAALDRLRAEYDVVVIEGAGSPAEINLAQYDIVNMRVARYADAPVLLVGDIDRGGVFASLYGTHALLPESDAARIQGFIINKFRGDPTLLDSGFEMLQARTGVPTLGVVPYMDLSRIPAEDALAWDALRARNATTKHLDIAIARLPRIANLDEFQPLIAEPDVSVRFVASAAELGAPDLIIVPGTKSTIDDLEWLDRTGLVAEIRARNASGTPVLGICGGFQMLGTRIIDESGAERAGDVPGLGLLPVTTYFIGEKVTRRVEARVATSTSLWNTEDSASLADAPLDGYEIHMGRTRVNDGARVGAPPFSVRADAEHSADGCTSIDGLIVGTYIHGLLENDALRDALLHRLATRKGIRRSPVARRTTLDDAFNELARVVGEHVDLAAIAKIADLPLLAGVS